MVKKAEADTDLADEEIAFTAARLGNQLLGLDHDRRPRPAVILNPC